MNRRSVLALTAAGLIGFCCGSARADETLKFREVLHATFAQTQDIGDIDGHAAGLARFSGIASFPDGRSEPAISLPLPITQKALAHSQFIITSR
jgi:hypothetical protein